VSDTAAAVSALYAEHRYNCTRVALRVTHDPQHAEEAVQEAFLMFWKQSARYDPQVASVGAWLAMLTHRRAVDVVRREQRQPHTRADTTELLDARPCGADGPETRAVASEEARRLRAALDALSADHREVLMLAYFDGLTQAEISTAIGAPVGTVKSRTYAALRGLRPAFA
jgi:RNA polymerase sigma factor (sigma-70 family)